MDWQEQRRKGRKILYTDVKEITRDNVIHVLQKAYAENAENVERINFLIDYDAGIQPLRRKEDKSYRPDIDCVCIDNVANEIATWWMAYGWSDPITLIQRGENDSGKTDEPKEISMLNEQYEAAGIDIKTAALSRFVEIAGIGYTYVDTNMDWEEGDAFFKLEALDPRYTFVVRSSRYIDKRIMLGVTYSVDDNGRKHFTAFSKDFRFEILEGLKIVNGVQLTDNDGWVHGDGSGDINFLHRIPIIEWTRNNDRMGCFERQISMCDNYNLLLSDFTNDVEQNTQAVWHGNDVEFPKDDDGNDIKPGTNEWIMTYTTQDGKTPFVKPLAVEYDYEGMLEMIKHERSVILQNAYVPERNENSGGSTGIGMNSATGYTSAEFVAAAQENIKDSCKMEEVKVVLAAIRENPYIEKDNPLLKLRAMDVKPKITRERAFEMSTKVNAMATMIKSGIYGLHAIKTPNLFDDPNQVWEDSKELIEKYQKSLFEKETKQEQTSQSVQQIRLDESGNIIEDKPDAGKTMQDEGDQNSNSPYLKG